MARKAATPADTETTWCPAIVALQRVIGGKWKIEILFYICLEGIHRFGQLKRRLGDISESTLSKQLRELVADGFLERVDFGEVRRGWSIASPSAPKGSPQSSKRCGTGVNAPSTSPPPNENKCVPIAKG
ncbi:helix-turn-helix domain-containing protein [Actinobaculum sp. 313]|uniref:winged helix-turn-helix transcriptional regulator n=1 Tax=Actinobaculum sp. 313 TaxID=2495645 RepID=UPI003204C654